MKGWVQSLQSLGAVDGPGVRFVIFLQGCPLRCAYCHNPETWQPGGGEEMDTDELVRKILRYRPYFGKEGGVTVSGGEPLMQPEFVAELFQKLYEEGIHTALDTSGIVGGLNAEMVLRHTDLALVDLKFTNAEDYRRYCKGDYHAVKAFLDLTERMEVPLWVRHVVIPGINDNAQDIRELQKQAKSYGNLEKLEWLPFHNMCKEKYDALGLFFPLAGTPALSKERLDNLIAAAEDPEKAGIPLN